MHNFEYKENARKLLTPEIVNLLSSIYEHKGRQQLFVEAKNDELKTLLEISKPERVKRLIQTTVGKISKKEILEKCPDISKKTVERALAELVKKSLIEKVGASSATAYVWIQK